MNDDNRTLLIQLGKAQIDGMFARHDEEPAIDDSEFLPLVEIVLTAFEKTHGDGTLADELWEHAFAVYDGLCKEHEPTSTTAENRELMRRCGAIFWESVEADDAGGKPIFVQSNNRTDNKETVMPKKKKPAARKETQMRWEFDPDIPTHDFFESGSLDEMWNLQEAVDSFVHWMEEDRFLMWEAVVREEKGIALTPKQKKAVGGLLNFNDAEDDQILYIDEIPRPSEPWHVILNKIVPHLLIEPYRTFDCHEEVKCDGWNRIVTALREHGRGLSLPSGVNSPEEVVPSEFRHKLWLQFCVNDLGGLGQGKEMTLEDPEEHYRVEWCLESLRECKDSVAFFGLTLESLLTRVVLPAKDQPIFVKMMQEKLGVSSAQEQIANHL